MHCRFFLILFILLTTVSCAKNKEETYNPTSISDPYKLYEEGLRAIEKGDYFFANKKFAEAELNFEVPELAAKSAIMSSYSLYGINFYNDAEDNLKRYLKTYPADKHKMYAKYLLSIIYYEQISDEKKDLKPLLKAKKQIDQFLIEYPDSDYTTDLQFKMGLIENQLAAKEIYLARYYISIKKWIPAINRLKIVTEKYNTTIFIEEALHRLVEIYYHIGLENEARSYAAILGYNYNSSEWFEKSYQVFNKDHKKILRKANQKEKEGLFKKIIELIK